MVRYGLEADHYDTYVEKVRALELSDVSAAARDVLQPDRLVWIVVGDRAVVEDGIQALGLGELHHIDADGNRLDQ